MPVQTLQSCTAKVMDCSQAGERQRDPPSLKSMSSLGCPWLSPGIYSGNHNERKYIYSFSGLGLYLFIIPLAMCSLGVRGRADAENLEANLNLLNLQFVFESI